VEQVAPGLCVGGAAVARDRQTLREAGVTHVVNCIGMLPPTTPFADELQYLVLHLLGELRVHSCASDIVDLAALHVQLHVQPFDSLCWLPASSWTFA
jgi:hypothetical protein